MRSLAVFFGLMSIILSAGALAQNQYEAQLSAKNVCAAIRAEAGDGLFRCDNLGDETTAICRGLRAVRTRTGLNTCENLNGIAKAICDGVDTANLSNRLNPCEYLNGMALEVCRGYGSSTIKSLIDPCEFTRGNSKAVCEGFLAATNPANSCLEQ